MVCDYLLLIYLFFEKIPTNFFISYMCQKAIITLFLFFLTSKKYVFIFIQYVHLAYLSFYNNVEKDHSTPFKCYLLRYY